MKGNSEYRVAYLERVGPVERVRLHLLAHRDMKGLDQTLMHCFHTGTERATELRVDDLQKVLEELYYLRGRIKKDNRQSSECGQ